MRLSDEAIKQGIVHPETLVRDEAVEYFAGAYSDDPTVMPCVIQAMETYGWDEALEYPWRVRTLAQTDETVGWCIEALEREGAPTPATADRRQMLSSVLSSADAALLASHKSRVMGLRGLVRLSRKTIAERIRLLGVDTETCWRHLERFCEEGRNRPHIADVDLGHASRLVEAIGRDGACADRVLSILAEKVEDYTDNPMTWMEGLAIRLAGEMRLEEAVPLLVAKLQEDTDWLREQCVEALAKIGTASVVEAICEIFPAAEWHCKLYSSSALEKNRSDLIVAKCLELYEREKHFNIRLRLLRAVLNCFSSDAIDEACELMRDGITELRPHLVAVATLASRSVPELERWKQEEKQHAAEFRRRRDAFLGVPVREQGPGPSPGPSAALPGPPVVRRQRVGRNDPCPCGSGKKYKKCCMRKEQ